MRCSPGGPRAQAASRHFPRVSRCSVYALCAAGACTGPRSAAPLAAAAAGRWRAGAGPRHVPHEYSAAPPPIGRRPRKRSGGRAADSNMAAAAGRRGGGLGRPPAPVRDVPLAGELVRPSVTELSQVRTNILCTVPGCGKVLPNSPALNMHLSKAHPLQVPP